MRMRNRIFRVYVHRDMQGDGRTDNIYIYTYTIRAQPHRLCGARSGSPQ